MSQTIQLRKIVEAKTEFEFGLSTRERIESAREFIFDFEYPLFDPTYKVDFETKFIRNFYMRNIGSETVGLFKFYLENWLIINMDYYNKMYESEMLKYDPLTNTKTNFVSNRKEDVIVDENGNVVEANTNKKDLTGNENENNSSVKDTLDNEKQTNDFTKNSATDEIQLNTLAKDRDKITDGTTATTTVADNFNRELYTEMPEERLNLTTNDGEGVLEYANKITENNENNTDTVNETSHGTENTLETDTENKDKNTTVVQTNGEIKNKDNTGNETESHLNNRDLTSLENVLENKNQDTLKNSVRDLSESYSYDREGKIGVTNYSKMVMDFRKAFLRIDKEIFNELEDLFMMVYS